MHVIHTHTYIYKHTTTNRTTGTASPGTTDCASRSSTPRPATGMSSSRLAVPMYICICVSVHTYVSVYTHVCIYVCMHVYACVGVCDIYTYISIYMCVCAYPYIHVCISVYAWMVCVSTHARYPLCPSSTDQKQTNNPTQYKTNRRTTTRSCPPQPRVSRWRVRLSSDTDFVVSVAVDTCVMLG